MAAGAHPGSVRFVPPAGRAVPAAVHASRRHDDPPAPPPILVSRVDQERLLVGAFGVAALGYGAAFAAILVLAFGTDVPATLEDGGALPHALLAVAGAVLAAVGAFAYDLPRHSNRRVWSVPLAWVHFLLLNAAFLGGAAAFHIDSLRNGMPWGSLVVCEVLAQVAGLAAMGVNVIESLLGAERPAAPDGPAPDTPPEAAP